MTRIARDRTIRFRIICDRRNTEGHKRVLELLAARSIIPDFHTTTPRDGDRLALEVVIRARNIWAINLARVFERLPTVLAVELEINAQQVHFHDDHD